VPESIANKRIVVTGASSGVGRAAATMFLEEGARVAMLARRAEILEAQAAPWGASAIPLRVDVSDPHACDAAMAVAHDRMGGFDLIVNAAGIAAPIPLPSLTSHDWNTVLATNLSGSFYVARYSGLRMQEDGGGAIVNIASELGSIGMSNYVAYCASKAGVIGMTKALAAELAPTVRVNALCPGPIDTPQLRDEFAHYPDPDRARRETLQRVPLQRFARAQEIVDAIRFLGFGAPFATGTAMALDGGTTAI
jgi:NAD(P)-dependent dehydrogenase (short-subunit alcohol dehydrogenase family)